MSPSTIFTYLYVRTVHTYPSLHAVWVRTDATVRPYGSAIVLYISCPGLEADSSEQGLFVVGQWRDATTSKKCCIQLYCNDATLEEKVF